MNDWTTQIDARVLMALVAAIGGALAYMARLYAAAKNAQLEGLKREVELLDPLRNREREDYLADEIKRLREELARIRTELREKDQALGALAHTGVTDRDLVGRLEDDRTRLLEEMKQLKATVAAASSAVGTLNVEVDAAMQEVEQELRKMLDVPQDAGVDEILDMIRGEGWTPTLFSEVVEGQELWACPVQCGIFGTVQLDPVTGRMGQAGRPTPAIAALEGLKRARGVDGNADKPS